MLRCLVLWCLHISWFCGISAARSRHQSGWIQPEVTLESLHLWVVYYCLLYMLILSYRHRTFCFFTTFRPFNVLMVPDPPGEVEKLRSDLFTHNRQRDAEGLSSSHDGVGIMQPAPSPSSGATESTFRESAYYQQPTSFIPLSLLYLFMVPRACKLLYGGRALAHEHIPVMTTFASFFIAFHICRAIFGVGLLTSMTCLLAAYGGHWAPRYVFEIFCVCGVMANVIYRVILAFVTLLLGGTHVPLWLAIITPIWYHLHMFVVSGVCSICLKMRYAQGILLGLIKIVPTYFAQDFVFAFSSLYVIFSGKTTPFWYHSTLRNLVFERYPHV
ncbi:hypothetical protein X943_003126 [Babesia divergens]|uniref:Integral membrane protein n=1 Tax=Babesia divergens TaxID=32595 RepID=A0AAD9G7I7_BABDI|nr:hypothetical protein X943_003126 [Babesia divergens]